MATILMKLSEERAATQYDRWISVLTLRQDTVLRNYIIDYILHKKGTLLDVGCGTGKLLVEAGRRGMRGIGVDNNKEMLQVAKERVKKHNLARRIKFRYGDATSLDFDDGSFDIVVSTLMVSELRHEQLKSFLLEAARVVSPEGQVVIGGEGIPQNRLAGSFFELVRALSFRLVSRLSDVESHPHYDIPIEMKAVGLNPKYRVSLMGGLFELFVAEA
ncbi:MAG: class I SAM-dependent methyltransferase [Candidatus Thorarchaeota archaeon]|jgi:ubiquinone/menaquinone biosynthesis C-methylase UbiE